MAVAKEAPAKVVPADLHKMLSDPQTAKALQETVELASRGTFRPLQPKDVEETKAALMAAGLL